jgi:hypothetical protein
MLPCWVLSHALRNWSISGVSLVTLLHVSRYFIEGIQLAARALPLLSKSTFSVSGACVLVAKNLRPAANDYAGEIFAAAR